MASFHEPPESARTRPSLAARRLLGLTAGPLASRTALLLALLGGSLVLAGAAPTAPSTTAPSQPDLLAASDSGSSSSDDITNVTDTTLTGLAEPGDLVTLYTDGALDTSGIADADGVWTIIASALVDGSHAMTVTATPTLGPESDHSPPLEIVIDVQPPDPPTLSVTVPPSPASTTSLAVRGSADAGSVVTLYTDSDCTVSAASEDSATFADPGIAVTVPAGSTTVFRASATDVAGNVSACSSSSLAYTEDEVPPDAPTIDVKPPDPTTDPAPSFAFSSADPEATVTCSLSTGAGDFAPCSSPVNYPVQADGTYTFTVRATDAAGNAASASHGFTIDTVPPTTVIDANPASPTDVASPDFGFSSEPGATFECSLTPTGEAPAYVPCTSPSSYGPLADGDYTFSVVATDAAGNVGPAVSYDFTIDTLSPEPPASLTATALSASEIALAWPAAADNVAVAGYDVYRDGLLLVTTSELAYSVSGLACGTAHGFAVVALDAAGNRSQPATASATTQACPPSEARTFVSVADAYVDGAAPTQNYGTQTKLRLDSSPDVRSYLRFDVSGLFGEVRAVSL
ncbi:MAG TPA: Ig-like domain-containing protein, partial [Gaiellaceae bacterium]|nr:Ig-like domain-containing protein [Gaiellaceae bacterium]